MNQEDVIHLLDALSWEGKDYFVLGDSALVIYGIRNYCKVISLSISPLLFSELSIFSVPDEEGFYKLTEEIEVKIENVRNYKWKGKYPVENLKSIVAKKKESGSLQDFRDIEKIKRYLKNKNLW